MTAFVFDEFDPVFQFEDRDYDPYFDAPRDEPPELDDTDAWAMAMFDPNEGWLDV